MDGAMLQTIWLLLCSFLVMAMQAGFAMTATGFTRAKNAGHTMAMNLTILFIGVFGYWAVGRGIQTGTGWFFSLPPDDPTLATFLFQALLMNVAATIPIGAMAERWTFKSFAVYGVFVSAVVYPLFARWVWGGGWLSLLGANYGLGHGVVDFAGSSVIHMTGGIAGLAGALALGPRTGKFRASGAPTALPGHNIPLAVAGSLVLFFGWFGLNGGRAFSAGDARIGLIAVNTLLASAAALVASIGFMWRMYGKPDVSLSVNGLLGGLVAISASCAYVSPARAALIGFVAGLLCCAGVFFVERKLRVDDPVGAVSAHAVCGIWGMIALGLFADGTSGAGLNGVPGGVAGLFSGGGPQLAAQLIGVLVNSVVIFCVMYAFFTLLNRITPLRVSEETEFEGLDQSEVAVSAYPDFNVRNTPR